MSAALQGYLLDHNAAAPTFDEAFMRVLVGEGRLRYIPEHPGMGPGSQAQFYSKDGSWVHCRKHDDSACESCDWATGVSMLHFIDITPPRSDQRDPWPNDLESGTTTR